MTPLSLMSGSLGDIFWDLPPWLTYSPGFDLGCTIYVANPTDSEKEYALMARLSRGGTVISEESLPVFGYAWFTVAPGDFSQLKGALRFSDSDADVEVLLMERESGAATDLAATRLVAPATSTLPPGWPDPGSTTGGTVLSSMLPLAMLLLLGAVMVSAFRPKQEKKEEQKALPAGRSG
jgi:hypothetical protein